MHSQKHPETCTTIELGGTHRSGDGELLHRVMEFFIIDVQLLQVAAGLSVIASEGGAPGEKARPSAAFAKLSISIETASRAWGTSRLASTFRRSHCAIAACKLFQMIFGASNGSSILSTILKLRKIK